MPSRLSEILIRASMLAPGKRLTITLRGESCSLPIVDVPLPPPPPDLLKVLTEQIAARDIVLIEANEQLGRQIDDVMQGVKETAVHMVESNGRVIEGMQELTDTLGKPVKPLYDETGKLIGAQRVDKIRG